MIYANQAKDMAVKRTKIRSFDEELDERIKKHAGRGEFCCYVGFESRSLYSEFWEELKKILVERGYEVVLSDTPPSDPAFDRNYKISWV